MKRNLLIALAVAVVALSAVNAVAQNVGRADIPFNFIVGNRMLPAGSYAVIHREPRVITLVSATEIVGTTVTPGHNETREATSSLVFRRIGQQYFLETAWISGEGDLIVPVSDRQKEALRAVSQKKEASIVAVR